MYVYNCVNNYMLNVKKNYKECYIFYCVTTNGTIMDITFLHEFLTERDSRKY